MTPNRLRALRDGLIVSGLIFNTVFLTLWTKDLDWFVDAKAWASIDLGNLYAAWQASPDVAAGFHYAPPIGWLMAPLSWLSWQAMVSVLTALNLLVVALMGRRWAPILLLAFPPVLLEIVNGNVHLFLAFAIWIGLRRPAAWAFVLLTKITPGVGLLWFAARREWLHLAIAVGATAGISIVSFVVAPSQWFAWFMSLTAAAAIPAAPFVPPLVVRLPIAALVAIYAGRTNRAWLVPVACFVAVPYVWLQSTAILTACFPLWWERDRRRPRQVTVPLEQATAGAAT